MKNNIVKGPLVVFFFLVLSVYAWGQDADDIVARMAADLSLSQAQVAAVRPVIEKYTDKLQKLKESFDEQGLTDDTFIFSQKEKLHDEERAELVKILDPGQIKKWDNKQKLSNFFNNDSSGDNGWAPKSSSGIGASF